MQYIYLHGFASSPRSFKARRFDAYFSSRGLRFEVPDLNGDDFHRLTLTRQLEDVAALIGDRPTMIVGSSLGGLTAAILAERYPNIARLVLLAPAFGFLSHWLPTFEPNQLDRWQRTGTTSLFHYGDHCDRELDFEFIRDLERYDAETLMRPVPTLIIHGQRDEVIPVSASQVYARDRDWVELIEVASDHSLATHTHFSLVRSFEFFTGSTDGATLA